MTRGSHSLVRIDGRMIGSSDRRWTPKCPREEKEERKGKDGNTAPAFGCCFSSCSPPAPFSKWPPFHCSTPSMSSATAPPLGCNMSQDASLLLFEFNGGTESTLLSPLTSLLSFSLLSAFFSCSLSSLSRLSRVIQQLSPQLFTFLICNFLRYLFM